MCVGVLFFLSAVNHTHRCPRGAPDDNERTRQPYSRFPFGARGCVSSRCVGAKKLQDVYTRITSINLVRLDFQRRRHVFRDFAKPPAAVIDKTGIRKAFVMGSI